MPRKTNHVICKLCNKCRLYKPLDQYFKRTENAYTGDCKPCHNIYRKQKRAENKKPTGFAKIAQEKQESIIQALKDGVKMKDIAADHNLSYATLCLWKRKGQIM